MIRNFETYDGDGEIDCDLCVVGAGPAGMAIAREFFGRKVRVVLLEAGGIEYEEASQEMYQGKTSGVPYYDLMDCRLRYFGGTVNHWGGMCSRLDPIDFSAREWVPHSGWPVTFEELTPYYERTHPFFDLGDFNYVQEEIVPEGTTFLELDPEKLDHKMWRYSVPPTIINDKYRADFEQASNVEVWLHACMTDIETDENAKTVTGLQVRSLGGKQARVRAKRFVLALGGIENPRMLLAANQVMPMGLGNQNDLVGRYFMEHLRVTGGTIVFSGDWNESYIHLHEGINEIRSAIRPSAAMQEREKILNTMTMFGEVDRIRWTSKGYGALFTIKEAVMKGELPEDLGRHLWHMISDVDGIIGGFFEKSDFQTYITIEGEQSPNPDSRVTLIEEKDALGLPKAELHWKLSPIDKRTVRSLVETIGTELGRLDAGRVQMEEWLADPDDLAWTDELIGENHHVGTTRMADDPKKGVVDRDCKVHGIDNLYIAGSSVFVTAGCANPTMNLTAFAFRLADHLSSKLT
jgi:choline dehydrogenase-like flavoprotein